MIGGIESGEDGIALASCHGVYCQTGARDSDDLEGDAVMTGIAIILLLQELRLRFRDLDDAGRLTFTDRQRREIRNCARRSPIKRCAEPPKRWTAEVGWNNTVRPRGIANRS